MRISRQILISQLTKLSNYQNNFYKNPPWRGRRQIMPYLMDVYLLIPLAGSHFCVKCLLIMEISITIYSNHQSSLNYANTERCSNAQNFQIFAGIFHPNLYLAIYYNPFFLQAHFSDLCSQPQGTLNEAWQSTHPQSVDQA